MSSLNFGNVSNFGTKIFPLVLLTFFLLLVLDKWLKVLHRKTMEQKAASSASSTTPLSTASTVSGTKTNPLITSETTITTHLRTTSTTTVPLPSVKSTDTVVIDTDTPKHILHILYSSTPDASWYAKVLKQMIEIKYTRIFIHCGTLDSYHPTGQENFGIFVTQGNYVPPQYTNRKQSNEQLRFAIFNLEPKLTSSSSSSFSTDHALNSSCGHTLNRIFLHQWKSKALVPLRTSISVLEHKTGSSALSTNKLTTVGNKVSHGTNTTTKENKEDSSVVLPKIESLKHHDQYQAWVKKTLNSIEPFHDTFYTIEHYTQQHTSASSTSSGSFVLSSSIVGKTAFSSSDLNLSSSLPLPPSSSSSPSSKGFVASPARSVTSTPVINKVTTPSLAKISSPLAVSSPTVASAHIPVSIPNRTLNSGIASSTPPVHPRVQNNNISTPTSISLSTSSTVSKASPGILNLSKMNENIRAIIERKKLTASSSSSPNVMAPSAAASNETKSRFSTEVSYQANDSLVSNSQRQIHHVSSSIVASHLQKDTVPFYHDDDHHLKHTIASSVYDNLSTDTILPIVPDSNDIAKIIENLTKAPPLIDPTLSIPSFARKLDNFVTNDVDTDADSNSRPSIMKPSVAAKDNEVEAPVRRGWGTRSQRRGENTGSKENETSTEGASSNVGTTVPASAKTTTESGSNGGTEMPEFIKLLRSADYKEVLQGYKSLQKEFIDTQTFVFTGFGITDNRHSSVNNPFALAGLLHQLLVQENGSAPGSAELYNLFEECFKAIQIKGYIESAFQVIGRCKEILKKAKSLDDKYPNHPGNFPSTLSAVRCGPFSLMIIDTILARCLSIVNNELKKGNFEVSEIPVTTAVVLSQLITDDTDIQYHTILRRYLGYIYTVCPLLVPDLEPFKTIRTANTWPYVEAAAVLHGQIMHTYNMYVHLPEVWKPWSFFARLMKYLPPKDVNSGEMARCLVQVITPLTFICFKYIVQEPRSSSSYDKFLVQSYGACGVALLKTFFRYVKELDKFITDKKEAEKDKTSGQMYNSSIDLRTYLSRSSLYKYLGDNDQGGIIVDEVKNMKNHTRQPGNKDIVQFSADELKDDEGGEGGQE